MKVPVFDPSFGTGFVAWFDSGFLLGTWISSSGLKREPITGVAVVDVGLVTFPESDGCFVVGAVVVSGFGFSVVDLPAGLDDMGFGLGSVDSLFGLEVGVSDLGVVGLGVWEEVISSGLGVDSLFGLEVGVSDSGVVVLGVGEEVTASGLGVDSEFGLEVGVSDIGVVVLGVGEEVIGSDVGADSGFGLEVGASELGIVGLVVGLEVVVSELVLGVVDLAVGLGVVVCGSRVDLRFGRVVGLADVELGLRVLLVFELESGVEFVGSELGVVGSELGVVGSKLGVVGSESGVVESALEDVGSELDVVESGLGVVGSESDVVKSRLGIVGSGFFVEVLWEFMLGRVVLVGFKVDVGIVVLLVVLLDSRLILDSPLKSISRGLSSCNPSSSMKRKKIPFFSFF